MNLFECAFQKDYDYYERVWNTELKKTLIRKIDTPFEWFEESSSGDFKSITNPEKRFVRKQGNSKQARGQAGVFNPIDRHIRDNYWQKAYNKSPKTWWLDIETRTGQNGFSGFSKPGDANQEISLMQVFDSEMQMMFIIGERPWKFQNQYTFSYNAKYIQCTSEVQIINTYLDLFKRLDPFIIHAWNGNGFDYPYIYNRMQNLGLDTNSLSNHGKAKLSSKQVGYKQVYSLSADGHYYSDLLEVYKKFTFGQKASYSLDNIAFEELGERKVPHTEYQTFDAFYTGDYTHPENPTDEQKASNIFKASSAYIETKDEKYLTLVKELAHSEFVYYGSQDTYLIKRIDEKKNFTQLMCSLAENMGIQIEETLGTVRPWSQNIQNIAYKNKEIIERREHSEEAVEVKGGRVSEVVPGKHHWVVSADVNSMYPSNMRAFNMSPETFIPKHKLPDRLKEYILRYFNDEDEDKRVEISRETLNIVSELLRENNMCLGITGAAFKTDSKGMIPQLVEDIYNGRKKAKKIQFEYEKKKIKIKDILKGI